MIHTLSSIIQTMTSNIYLKMQLADANDVMEEIRNIEGVHFPVLTPNLKVSCAYWVFMFLFMYCSWRRIHHIQYSFRVSRQLLQRVRKKLRYLHPLQKLFLCPISIVALRIALPVIRMFLMLQKHLEYQFVGMSAPIDYCKIPTIADISSLLFSRNFISHLL